MPKLNTLKSLGSLFRSSIKSTPATTTSAAAAAVDKSIKPFVSSLDASSASTPKRTLVKSHKHPQPSKPPSPVHLSSLVSIGVDTSSCSDSVWCADGLSVDLRDLELAKDGRMSPRLEKSREWKQNCVFKKVQADRFNRAVHSLGVRLGVDAALDFFGKFGFQIGMKEFNTLLKICIENASTTDDETVALEQVTKAFKVFMSMKEQGFPIEEESYGQVLLYLIDKGMVEQFHLFSDIIKDGSASRLARLGYYEELLYTRVSDEEKVGEFCNCNFTSDGDGTIGLRDVVSRAVVDGGDC